MKQYNSKTFFKHTFCYFQQVKDVEFPENTNYKSKSDSYYYYTKEGVYRKSNHWGRVANCRWKIITTNNYKNQKTVVGFAKWSDFYPIHSLEKSFYIEVNFQEKTATIKPNDNQVNNHLFSYLEVQKRIKKINHLLKSDKWAKYFDVNINTLRKEIIQEYISSYKTLATIKSSLK